MLPEVFKPPTHEAVRKGKASKPTEFGKVVKIQETENQFITDYEVCAKRAPDQALWGPWLKRRQWLFGRPPELATADGGFASATNKRQAQELGVKHVALLRRGRRKGGPARPRRVRVGSNALVGGTPAVKTASAL